MSLRIVASSPTLELSGANVLLANLLDQLRKSGIQAEWIVTGHNPTDDAAWLGRRTFEIHRLPPTRLSDVRRRQKFLLEHLGRSPCIYLPNFDFDMACAVPALPSESAAVFIVHCDDPIYYDFVARHVNLFNAIVCVSRFVTQKLQAAHPACAERIVHIPFGVDCPEQLPQRKKQPSDFLEVAYCGRLSFYQKRIQDVAEIIRRCHSQRLPIRFSIAGTGPDERVFFQSITRPMADGVAKRLGFLSNTEVLNLLSKSDVLLMTSEFEGLPVVLLEAMSRGCIPVVSHTVSGMAEVVEANQNGFLISVGDVDGFVCALSRLAAEPELRHRVGSRALERISAGGFTLTRAATEYQSFFRSLILGPGRISCMRNGKAIIPRNYRLQKRILSKTKRVLNFSGLLHRKANTPHGLV